MDKARTDQQHPGHLYWPRNLPAPGRAGGQRIQTPRHDRERQLGLQRTLQNLPHRLSPRERTVPTKSRTEVREMIRKSLSRRSTPQSPPSPRRRGRLGGGTQPGATVRFARPQRTDRQVHPGEYGRATDEQAYRSANRKSPQIGLPLTVS